MSNTTSHRVPQSKFVPLGHRQRGLQATTDSIRRLNLESRLEGHSGCVNCLQWNQNGRLLASGSDDRDVVIWDPFKGLKRTTIQTGHDGNIFSVKFMPDFSDSSIATGASDGSVKLIDISTNEKLLDCKTCHQDRVKRLAVHPNQPHVIWSASEDGCILQYDTRERHCCLSTTTPKNILIDLKTAAFGCLAAKCIDINPIRDEMIAIGANDVHVRLFDRRYVRPDSWESCTAYFTPGHMIKKANSRSFGTTYLAFNQDGSELLANIHAEQVYLFNTYEPQEPYKSFNNTAKQLFLDLPTEPIVRKSALKIRSQSRWDNLRSYCKAREQLPEKYTDIFKNLETKIQTKERLVLKEFGIINDMLIECKNCSELYQLRAAALVNRRWRGDLYQAMRDCCYALALKPGNLKTLEILSRASHHSGDKESARAIDRALNQGPETPEDTDSSMDDDDSAMEFYENIAIREISAILPGHISSLSSRTLLPTLLGVNSNDIHKMTDTFSDLVRQETERASAAYDYTKRFYGHCNMNTDIKEANFFGDFIVAGSDDGAFYIWDKNSTNLIKAVYGDMQILNCLQPHPSICMLATSGIEPAVKIWSASGRICQDVESVDQRCQENQNFIISDPLEAMIMRLYPPQRDN